MRMQASCWLGPPWLVLAACSGGGAESAIAPSSDWPVVEIPLFPEGEVPGEEPGFPPEARYTRTNRDNGYVRELITNVSRPTLERHLVANGTGASVIVAPGGAYSYLELSKEGVDAVRRLNTMGISAFLLKYRVPLRTPRLGLPSAWAQLQDAQRAVSLVRSRAADWGLDSQNIGFMGFSSGGHLAALLAATCSWRIYPRVDDRDDWSSRPDAMLLLYPWKLLKGNAPHARELAPDITVDRCTPPAFVAQAGDDDLAFPQNALAYFRALTEVEPAVRGALHIYPAGGHGFGLCQEAEEWEECCDWPEAARRWLQDLGMAPGGGRQRRRPLATRNANGFV